MFRTLSLAFLLAACGGDAPAPTPDPGPAAETAKTDAGQAAPDPSAPGIDARVKKAAAIAKEAKGGDLDKVLEKHGLTAEELEELLYEIAADPTLSASYQASRQ
ncbi:MAG: hypothetical protein EA397_04250 [Deltaproteobacteria bacterium]|nr:MAG: hypothetical protein EA397_04250 [Deltaproteobacteria bacterium]